jgi:hypothetical protein
VVGAFHARKSYLCGAARLERGMTQQANNYLGFSYTCIDMASYSPGASWISIHESCSVCLPACLLLKNTISRRVRRGGNIRQNNCGGSELNEPAASWPARNTGTGTSTVTSAPPATLLG